MSAPRTLDGFLSDSLPYSRVPAFAGVASDTEGLSLPAAAAGFLFSIRVVFVLVSARWLNAGTEAGVSAGFIFEGMLLLVAALQACGAAGRPVRWTFRLPPVRWVMFFLAFSCISLVWSATVSRPASAMYWGAMASDVAIVLILLRTGTPADVAHSMMKGYIAAAVLVAAVAWIIPLESDQRLGDLDYFNTNQIGNICAMGVFMAQLLVARNDGRWRVSQIFLMLTLLRSLSKATLVAFLVSQGVLFLRNKSMTRGKKTAICVAVLGTLLAFSGIIGSYYNDYTTTGNQAQTLTGRTGIWIYCLNAGFEKPWIGNGIDALWKVAPTFGPELYETRHAENELLQQFFAYGLVGIILLAGTYGSLYRSIRRLPRTPTRAVFAALLLYIVIRGLAEAEPFDLLLPLWSIVLLGAYAASAGRSVSMHLASGVPPCKEAGS